ncbi:hypothetical protein LOAG_16348 [Loa loa]|uniref:Uncharacterized protein n=1 Tax=Loa loa TaxID=7209 RepID=A0A1S0UMY3_LOALO|nr:hypothetical protein LOAG_16348 [Loa loa]EJD76768.1 hypothetical protein LOAG_16348 [Loa loa]
MTNDKRKIVCRKRGPHQSQIFRFDFLQREAEPTLVVVECVAKKWRKEWMRGSCRSAFSALLV